MSAPHDAHRSRVDHQDCVVGPLEQRGVGLSTPEIEEHVVEPAGHHVYQVLRHDGAQWWFGRPVRAGDHGQLYHTLDGFRGRPAVGADRIGGVDDVGAGWQPESDGECRSAEVEVQEQR